MKTVEESIENIEPNNKVINENDIEDIKTLEKEIVENIDTL